MLLSLVLHTYSMRYVLPAAVMMGTAPTYVLAWGAWRLLSAVLPTRFYREVDDRLYTIYQSMVLFFFENYTGVQVSRPGRARGLRRPGERPAVVPALGSPPRPPRAARRGARGQVRPWPVPGTAEDPPRSAAAAAPLVMLFTECWCCVRFAGRGNGRDATPVVLCQHLNGSRLCTL